MLGFNRKKFVVLTATPQDHKEIAALHGQSFARGWSKPEIEALAQNDNTTLLVSRQVGSPEGAICGFNIIRNSGQEAEILSVAVDAKDRRHGIADMLMREAIIRLRADRVEALLLEVDENNQPAIRLYEKLGFTTVGNRPGYYGPKAGETAQDLAQETEVERAMALVMRLDLV